MPCSAQRIQLINAMTSTQIISQSFNGQVRRRVFGLALPAVGEQLLNTAVGLTDVYLVGNLSFVAASRLGYTSAAALSSVGLGNQMIWLVTVLFLAFGIGSTALIARASGAGDRAGMQTILRQSILVGTGVGVLAMIFMFVAARGFLQVLATPADVLPLSETYLHIIALTLAPTALLFIGNACLRGIGDTRTPLYVMLGANAVNITITWLLVNGNLGMPALGVSGAALGTAVGRGGGGIIVVVLLLRGRSGLRLVPDLRPDWAVMRRIINIGTPSAGEMLVFHGALLIFTRLVNSMGTVSYAAHNVTISIESLSFLPGMGYAAAAATLVGQGLGARSPHLSEAYAYESLWQGSMMMSLGGIFMALFPETLLSFFVNDPLVIAAGIAPLRAAGLVQPALAVSFILSGALRGAGDTRWPLYIRLISTWGIRLPLALLTIGLFGMGLEGMWLAMCTDFTVQGLLAFRRFGSAAWQRIEV